MDNDINEDKYKGRYIHLTRELMANTLVNEVTRVMLSAPTLADSVNSFLLGITEISSIEKTVLYGIDCTNFCLKPKYWRGADIKGLRKLHLPLSFLSGEYPDSIFLNRHIIVDPVDHDDPFYELGVQSYVVMPIVSRITTKCWEVRKCGKESCPCYEGHNPYCWSVSGAAMHTDATTEDEKRRACINCPQFKSEGMLWLDTTNLTQKISGDIIAHLTGLNRHLGMVIETFNMYTKLEDANIRLEENNDILSSLNNELNLAQQKINAELDHARSIQNGLLPSKFPKSRLKDIASRYVPAGKVGGDYYDCFAINEDLLGILMADVSGHGIAAALIMSMFKVLLKKFTTLYIDPLTILTTINQTFLNEIKGTNYVTVFFATFNNKTRQLTYCNAGHTPQILLTDKGDFKELKANGLFVGVLDDIMLQQQVIDLPEKSRLVLYTDGITEARSPDHSMFSFEKLKNVVLNSADASCTQLQENIMSSLGEHCQDLEANDDITLFIVDL